MTAGAMVWDTRSALDGWERSSRRIQHWCAGHPTLLRRLRLARALSLWAGIALLAALLVSQPRLRESGATMLSLYWLLIAWFLLCRTKTLSWRFVSSWYAGSLIWSVVVGKATSALALSVTTQHIGSLSFGGNVRADGPLVAIAGLGEESLKILPLALFALFAARRLHRLALTDYLLLGLTSGLAFQSCEEILRRLAAHVVRPGLLSLLLGEADSRGPLSGYSQYSISPLSGWSRSSQGLAEFPGHHILTAIVAVSAGFGVWLWRAGRGRSVVAAAGLRMCGIAVPILALWVAVGVHGGYNAVAALDSGKWTGSGSPVPWPIRIGWQVGLHGKHLGVLLLVLWLIAMLLDSRRRRLAEVANSLVTTMPFRPIEVDPARELPVTVTSTATPLRGRARRALGGVAADLRSLARYTAGDAVRSLRAHARRTPEPRAAALIRGRAATAALRVERAEAMAAGSPKQTRPAWVVRRLTAGLAVGGIAAEVVLVAPSWARQIGPSLLTHRFAWLAAILDQLADWWHGQPFAMQMLYVFGAAALIALSGGSLGVALFGSGVLAYVAEHGHGEADFIRDPNKATASYFASTTPQGMVIDALEFGLTFWPPGYLGAKAGQAGREAIEAAAREAAERASEKVAAEKAAAELVAAEKLAAEKLAAEKAAAQKGPGSWAAANESMSSRAAAYQEQITGRAAGSVYKVNGVKFDGYANGALQEAKGPGYASFVKNGLFQKYFRGAQPLVYQARRQLAAAGGTPITWSVAEQSAATAMEDLLASSGVSGITVVFAPPVG